MYFVYIIYSESFNKTYVGATHNLELRIFQHNSGKSNYTKKYKPWSLVYTEEFESKEDAFSREKFYKSSAGRDKMKVIIELYKNEI